ncbi:unnamed protein product [Amoebophrya sp. A25]|nr:unnamed protein product [Amoebophrya sp. A25]|eukprot:GSA25T00014937001.1
MANSNVKTRIRARGLPGSSMSNANNEESLIDEKGGDFGSLTNKGNNKKRQNIPNGNSISDREAAESSARKKKWRMIAGTVIVTAGAWFFFVYSASSGEKLVPVKMKEAAAATTGTGEKKIKFPVPPDTRPAQCLKKTPKYDVGNSTVSIVIPYLREKYVHIKGTVGSIIAHTPANLLKEIIFISDGNNEKESHQEKIEQLSPLARVIRLPSRHGLIYAKQLGAKEAKGDVVMFFEPHCIVGYNWLEPLVHYVRINPRSLVLPTLDYIPQDNFRSYAKAANGRYRFEWNFNLIYTNPPTGVDPDTSRPYFAPATSGGIFAIKKQFFLELELFDVPMKQWGGDQIELSFKAWRCGSGITVVPCARVGHLFRDVAFRPYPVDVPQVVENYAKLARVWLEPPYLEAFYKVKPEARGMAMKDDLSISANNFKRLQCKSMNWYITNVDLELGWEATRICIPGAKGHPSGCELDAAAPGRSTIDRVMPEEEYRDWAADSEIWSNLDELLDNIDKSITES